MKSIQDLAREAGANTYRNRHMPDRPFNTFSPEQLQRFAALVIEQEHKRLLEGSGDPFIGVQYNQGWDSWEQVIPSAIGQQGVVACYTADQMAAAVLRATLAERDRDEYQCAADDLAAEAKALRDAAIRGQR